MCGTGKVHTAYSMQQRKLTLEHIVWTRKSLTGKGRCRQAGKSPAEGTGQATSHKVYNAGDIWHINAGAVSNAVAAAQAVTGADH